MGSFKWGEIKQAEKSSRQFLTAEPESLKIPRGLRSFAPYTHQLVHHLRVLSF